MVGGHARGTLYNPHNFRRNERCLPSCDPARTASQASDRRQHRELCARGCTLRRCRHGQKAVGPAPQYAEVRRLLDQHQNSSAAVWRDHRHGFDLCVTCASASMGACLIASISPFHAEIKCKRLDYSSGSKGPFTADRNMTDRLIRRECGASAMLEISMTTILLSASLLASAPSHVPMAQAVAVLIRAVPARRDTT